MKVKEVVDVVTDNQLNIELIEHLSGASFDITNSNTLKSLMKCETTLYGEFGEKEVKNINVQYINGKRCLIIKF